MRSGKVGTATRLIIGGISVAAIAAGITLLLGDISGHQQPRLRDQTPVSLTDEESSARRLPPPPPGMVGPGGDPRLAGIPAAMRPGMPPGIPPGQAPQYYPMFARIWRMTPTTVPLTKIPEGKPFLADIRMIVEIQLARYGNGAYVPLSPADQAQIMVDLKPRTDTRFAAQEVGGWQVVRLGGEDYLRAWRLPDGVHAQPREPTNGPMISSSRAGMKMGGVSGPVTTINGKTSPPFSVTLYNRPDHPEIPSGVKAEPIQIPLRGLGYGYSASGGSHFMRVDFTSVTLDKRANEKWTSLPLPTIPKDYVFVRPTNPPRFAPGVSGLPARQRMELHAATPLGGNGPRRAPAVESRPPVPQLLQRGPEDDAH